MPNSRNRLGKGLDALIPVTDRPPQEVVQPIDIDTISANPFQPRQIMDEAGLDDLALSIKQHGLTQPIVVRPISGGYELVVGERRLQASKRNGATTIAAIVKPLSDKESCEIALIENMDRENLSVIEVAQSFKRLIDEFGYTQKTLGNLFSRSRSSVANILRLLKLPDTVQSMILHNQLSEGHARTLIHYCDDPQECIRLANNIVDQQLTVRDAEATAKPRASRPSSKRKPPLFDQYTHALSEKLKTPVRISHKKNSLTLTVKYDRFKDYIAFLDHLCAMDMPSNES